MTAIFIGVSPRRARWYTRAHSKRSVASMRNGYRVYDSDTHVGPSADTLERYLSSRVRELVPDLESRKCPTEGIRRAWPMTHRTRSGSASAAAKPLVGGEPTS